MRLPSLLIFLPLASANVLMRYSAADGDDTRELGLLNLQGWDRAQWPSGEAMNSSLYFTTSTDPDGTPAAHVHKDAHFTRSEYHSLKGRTKQNTTYYIGYHVRFDKVDCQTIVWQWKNYDSETVGTDNIPAALVFRKNSGDNKNHTINFAAQPDPDGAIIKNNVVWTKQLTMGKAVRFGIVINTSENGGYIQLYYNGNPATMTDPATGKHTRKLSGNFWPGPTASSDPKFGLYGGKNNKDCDSYIYDVVIGTKLSDIADVAGIDA
ncbi:hypothetical protein B0J13DRAFT_606088 [Dactylonectria estremocensis]|uniref:Alginate lyase 2 domain-containing protein n=1 Tax=Dactylonectria estremocensis TaxID=1079267 RepID=A0A9P9F3D7_9HYPO|nr:hypothetical protein B0J13DRAFT_606088 [Dactylonectria estremocensis]